MRCLTFVVVTLFGSAFLLQACTQSVSKSELRILNASSHDVRDLIVIFPDEQITFSAVAAGEVTEYQEVQGGVYGYAAYRFEIDGEQLAQDVNDFLGAQPMEAGRYTYEIVIDPSLDPRVSLSQVMRDE